MWLQVFTLLPGCVEAMEPFHPRPFLKVGSTRDEVVTLKKQYERMPHDRKMAAGKKMAGDSGMIDLSAIQDHDAASEVGELPFA
jgi:hypothetical protein